MIYYVFNQTDRLTYLFHSIPTPPLRVLFIPRIVLFNNVGLAIALIGEFI